MICDTRVFRSWCSVDTNLNLFYFQKLFNKIYLHHEEIFNSTLSSVTEVPIWNVSEHFVNKTNDNQTVSLDIKEISDYMQMTRMIHVTVRPMLIVFEIIGNLLSFYVLRRGSLKNVSTCFYMSILALSDTGK